MKSLKNCFHNKCYLCETKEPHDINVEHLSSHQGDSIKKFDWNNLYLVCSRCNNIKLTGFDDLLDCCDPNIDVTLSIKLLPPHTPYTKKVFIMAMNQDKKTVTTAKLLDKIYNSEHTINKEITGSFLRRRIYDQLQYLHKNIRKYFSPDATTSEKKLAIEKMRELTSESSAYSAFVIHSILDDEELCDLVFEKINHP